MRVLARRALASLALLASQPVPLQARDVYMGLTGRNDASCFNFLGCRPAAHQMTAAGVQAFVGRQWITVPNEPIQYHVLPGDTGEPASRHWCGWHVSRGTLVLRTILPLNSTAMTRDRP